MNDAECETISESLVDYADGELPATESASVSQHLTTCGGCRARLDALRRSLEAAHTIWADAQSELIAAGQPRRTDIAPRRSWVRRAGLAAAALVLMIGGERVWKQLARPTVDPIPPTSRGPSLAEIEREIHLAALPVQMLAAADFLAEQSGGQEIACERYEYIAAAYPDSDAAIESARKHLQLCN
jgi:hypothetical protein